MANPLRMRYKLISTNVKKIIFMIKEQVQLKKKSLFRRLITRHITSEENIYSSEILNLAANKKNELFQKI